ncbi:MAG: hypothetical protein IKT60_06310 [Clostridia bacterium]|nr:hypothetical protein [Clostridia bacterium]
MKKGLSIVIVILMLLGLLTMCNGGDDYDAYDLRDAQKRYYSGNYTREDERMVQGFNKWKADQNKYID